MSVSTRGTVAETAAAADVVVLAVPATAATEVLGEAGSLDGKILVDATNNLSGGPAGLVIAELCSGATYVKAFNAIFATFMHDTPTDPPASLVYCGDDADAKATVAELVARRRPRAGRRRRRGRHAARRGIRAADHRDRLPAGARPVRLPLPAELSTAPPL